MILLAAMALSVLSCTQERSLLQELDGIESYVTERPDSALQRLAQMDTSAITSPAVRARYSLLTSWGRYRLYQEEDDEVALADAAEYFRLRNDEPRLMRTLFLLGYRQYIKGDAQEAIISLSEAEPLTETVSDDFLSGLVFRQMALTFEQTHNLSESPAYYHKAAERFYRGGYETHGRYATLREGAARTSASDLESGRDLISGIYEYAREHSDTSMLVQASLMYANNLVRSNVPEMKIPVKMFLFVRDTVGMPLSFGYLSDLGYAYASMGEKAKAEACFKEADAAASNAFEHYCVDYLHFWSSVMLKDDAVALGKAKDIYRYLEKAQLPLVAQSAVNYQRAYFYEQRQTERLNHALSRQKLLNIILITIIAIAMVSVLSIGVIRALLVRKKDLQTEVDNLSGRIATLEEEQSQSIRTSLLSGMKFFNKLAEFKWQNQPHRIIPYLDSMFSQLANDARTYGEISQALNESMNRIVDRLQEQVPSLKRDDLLVYCYLAHQFDHTTLCAILNKTPGALNAKIYRIREKILASHAKDADEFLRAIKDR